MTSTFYFYGYLYSSGTTERFFLLTGLFTLRSFYAELPRLTFGLLFAKYVPLVLLVFSGLIYRSVLRFTLLGVISVFRRPYSAIRI